MWFEGFKLLGFKGAFPQCIVDPVDTARRASQHLPRGSASEVSRCQDP